MPVSSMEMYMCSGCRFSASRSLCYKSSFWFSIFIGLNNCGRQKLLAHLSLPAVPGLDRNCGIPFLCVTAERSLLILQGHQELGGAPRATEQTYLYGWWHECSVLVLPDTGWLGSGVAGTPATPAPLLKIPFSVAVSGQVSAVEL